MIDRKNDDESIDWIYGQRQPSLRAADAAKADAKNALKQLEDLYDRHLHRTGFSKEGFYNSYKQPQLARVASGKSKDEEALKSAYFNARTIEFLYSIYEQPQKHDWVRKRKSNSIQGLVDRGLLNRLNETRTKLTEIRDQLTMLIRDQCEENILFGLAALPDQAGIDAARKKVDLAKETVDRKVLTFFSKESRAKLASVVLNTPVILPPTQKEFLETAQVIAQTSKRLAKNWKEWSHKNADSLFLLTEAYRYAREDANPAMDIFEELSPCKELEIEIEKHISSMHPQSKSITISWEAMHEGDRIHLEAAHELGHIISRAFKNKKTSEKSASKYLAVTNCLERKHNPASRDFVEEDFADWVMNKSNTTQKNLFCFYIKQDTDLSPDPHYSSVEFPPAKPGTHKHSTHPFRILHAEHVSKGRLPKACEGVVQETRPARDFSVCPYY